MRISALTAAIWLLTVVLGVAMVLPDDASDLLVVLQRPVAAAITFCYATVGALLRSRPGASRVGTLMLAGALMFVASVGGFIAGGRLRASDAESALATTLVAGAALIVVPGLVAILPALALVFPTGHLPGPRWRVPVVLASLPGLGALLLADPGTEAMGLALVTLAVLLWAGLGTVGVVVRYRRAGEVVRRQLRWFLASIGVTAPMLVLAFSTASRELGLAWLASMTLIPISVGIAITRYRLYDIDRLISRGLSWAILSAALVSVYVGAVLVLQGVLAGVTQGQTLAVAASTLAAAALFQPLRRRLQRAMDLRFDRARYDAERVIATFGARLRDEVDLDAVGTQVRHVAEVTVRPAGAAVWLRNVQDRPLREVS